MRRTRWPKSSLNNPKRKEIVEKIKKLLAVHDNTTSKGEAQNALKLAQKLMVQYRLSEWDLKEPVREQQIIHVILFESAKVENWRTWFALLLADNFRCVAYKRKLFYPDKGTQLRAFGLKDDIDIFQSAYLYTVEVAENLFRMYCEETGKDKRSARASYFLGFYYGLKTAFEEQAAENPEWGLVLVTPDRVKQEAEKLHIKRRTQTVRVGDYNAYNKGWEHGREHDPLRKRISD